MYIVHIRPGAVPADAQAVQVPMRDGVLLAADVYLPEKDWTGPIVLVRLPYDKDGDYCFMPEVARYVTAHEYGVVVQDVRGKYRSEGKTTFGVHEVDDGFDTIDWITQQRFSDGNVVMWGDSYFGMTQLAAAASSHPALKAISPRVTGTQLALCLENQDGSADVDQTSRRGYFAMHYVDRDLYEWDIDFGSRPLADTFEEFFAALGKRSPNYDHDLARPSSLRALTVDQLLSAPAVPTLYTIGWFDNCAIWSWHDVEQMLAHPTWSGTTFLRLEGIDHESYSFSEAPIAPTDTHDASPDARAALLPKIVGPALKFFDYVLGRTDQRPAKVTYEICHDTWFTSNVWPPAQARPVTFNVSSDSGSAEGRLGMDLPPSEGDIRWHSDGINLVPSAAANPFAMVLEMSDLSETLIRPDVALAASVGFDDGLVLAGPVELTGTVISDQPSTDIFARLLEVAPDGYATPVTRGQVRLSNLSGPAPFRIDMLHAGYRVRPGHHLVLHLASTDYPEFTFNTGDGTDSWSAKRGADTTTVLPTGGDGGLKMTLSVINPDVSQIRGPRE